MLGAWVQRPDCEVVDEPLYGHWLHLSGAQHPVREQVMAQQVLPWAPSRFRLDSLTGRTRHVPDRRYPP